MSYTKALAAKFPRGVNIIGEADFSYPLPTQVSDWFVKPRTPGAVKPSRIDVGIDANNINIINGRAPTSMTVNRTTSLVNLNNTHLLGHSLTRNAHYTSRNTRPTYNPQERFRTMPAVEEWTLSETRSDIVQRTI